MYRSIFAPTALLIAALQLSACAGPTTPFGALNAWLPASLSSIAREPAQVTNANDWRGPRIHFLPDRQVLHDQTRLKVVIDDPIGIQEDAPVKLFYNGIDVTRAYLAGSTRHLLNAGTRLEIVTPHLRLKPSVRNRIEVQYLRAADRRLLSVRYRAPECSPFSNDVVRSTGRFNPPERWMKNIASEAKRSGMNPNLLAGLIAQESSFNPRALSWARALGLTQVTPLADREIEKDHPEWPRMADFDQIPFVELKALVMTRRVTGHDDWRLDPALSIQGGVNYLDLVGKYWQNPSNAELIQKFFTSADDGLVKLMLASYNSGPSRVNRALREKGSDFLLSPELKEAREYVNRILSYCYHFSKEDPSDENST